MTDRDATDAPRPPAPGTGESGRTDTATPRTVLDAYLELLGEEGYRPRADGSDGESTLVTFKAQGTRFLLFAYEDDPTYFRLGVHYDLPPGPRDALRLAELANDQNTRWKGVKTVLDLEDGSVRFVVETFLTGPATGDLLERTIRALGSVSDEFFGALRPPERLDA